MKTVKDLTKAQLQEIVISIQGALYVSMDNAGIEFFNPTKPWDNDSLEDVANTLERFGLKPDTSCDLKGQPYDPAY